MAIVEELLRGEASGAISFGNYKLSQKAKLEDFQHAGDLLKVKTYNEITKLEKKLRNKKEISLSKEISFLIFSFRRAKVKKITALRWDS